MYIQLGKDRNMKKVAKSALYQPYTFETNKNIQPEPTNLKFTNIFI